MTPTHVNPERTNPGTPAGVIAEPRAARMATADDVMREQLDFLIEHAQAGPCGCSQCGRYQRARSTLLEIFG